MYSILFICPSKFSKQHSKEAITFRAALQVRLHTMFPWFYNALIITLFDNTVFPPLPPFCGIKCQRFGLLFVSPWQRPCYVDQDPTFIMAPLEAHTYACKDDNPLYSLNCYHPCISSNWYKGRPMQWKNVSLLERACIHVFFLDFSKDVHIPFLLFLHPHTENKENVVQLSLAMAVGNYFLHTLGLSVDLMVYWGLNGQGATFLFLSSPQYPSQKESVVHTLTPIFQVDHKNSELLASSFYLDHSS